MGADMLLVGIPFDSKIENTEDMCHEILDAIDNAIDGLCDDMFGLEDFCDNEFGWSSADEGKECDALIEKLEELKDEFNKTGALGNRLNWRDISIWWNVRGLNLVIAGGMSYGDSPTDAFELFAKLMSFPEKILRAHYIGV